MIKDEKSILIHGCMEAYNRLFIDNFLIIIFFIHIHVIFQIKNQFKISFLYFLFKFEHSLIHTNAISLFCHSFALFLLCIIASI